MINEKYCAPYPNSNDPARFTIQFDNIIFIIVPTDRLPAHQQARGRYLGLARAMGLRILLLLSIAWIMSLTTSVYEALGQDLSIRDFILLGGGVFLIFKATPEIYNALEVEDDHI